MLKFVASASVALAFTLAPLSASASEIHSDDRPQMCQYDNSGQDGKSVVVWAPYWVKTTGKALVRFRNGVLKTDRMDADGTAYIPVSKRANLKRIKHVAIQVKGNRWLLCEST